MAVPAVQRAPLAGHPVRPAQPGLGVAGWTGLAALVALLEAGATFVDPKLGVAFAVTLIVGGAIVARPVLLLPLAIVTVFLEHLTFQDMAITRILAPAALLLVAAELLRGGARLRPAAPLAWAVGYVAWAAASGLWTESGEGTRFLLQSLGIALIFMIAFATLPRTADDIRRFLHVAVFAAAVLGGMSVFAFGGMLGDIPHLDLLQDGRSQGGVGDPDFFAAIQLVMAPLALVLASDTKNPRVRVYLYCAVLVILASAFTSLSRGGFIGIVVLGVLFLVSRPENLFRSRQEKAAAMLVVALGMAGFFSRPWLRSEVVGRAQTIYAPQNREDESGSGRTNLWKAAARTAEENPFLGIGFGSFIYVSQELILKTPGVDPKVLQLRQQGENFVAHNTYIGTVAELGFTGLLLYLGVLISTGLALRRTAARAAAVGADLVGRVAHALLLGLATWAVTSVFLSAETARTFWIIVGLSLALPRLLPRPGYLARSNAPMS